MTDPILLKPRRVAMLLDCSIRTVYELVKNGELIGHSHHRSLRGLRVTTESVKEYTEKYKIPQTSFYQ